MNPDRKNDIPNGLKVSFIVINLALLTLGLWFFKFQQKTQQHEVESHLMDIARLKAQQISDWRKDRLADAAVLMGSPGLIRSIENYLSLSNNRDREEILKRFSIIKEQYDYSDILLVNPVNQAALSVSGKTGTHTGYISALDSAISLHKPIWTKLHPELEYPLPHLSVVAPLFSAGNTNHPLGAIVLICDAQNFLYPLIQSWPVSSKTAETLLIRREGDDVVFLNELRHRKNTALKLRISIQQADLPAAMAVSGKTGIVNGKDYRNVDVVAAILPVPGSPWFIVSKIDKKEAFSDWHFRSVLILSLMIGSVSFVMVAGLLIWQRNLKTQYQKLYRSESNLRHSMEKHSVTLSAIGDAVISTDAKGFVELMNPVAEKLTGWTMDDARGLPLSKVFHIINEETRDLVENPVMRVLKEGTVIGLANHTLLIDKQGNETAIADSGAPIRDETGKIIGVVLVFRDQNEERLNQKLIESRLAFIDYASSHSIDDFLIWALDQVEKFLGSTFSVYSCLYTDQQTPATFQWSSNLKRMIDTSQRLSDMINQCSLWIDFTSTKKTVIRNDFTTMTNETNDLRKLLKVDCLLAVPVIREGNVVAACYICGKPTGYTKKDAEIVTYFADLTWEILSQKRTAEALIKSEERFRSVYENTTIGLYRTTPEGQILMANPALVRLLGFSSFDELSSRNLNKEGFRPEYPRSLFLKKMEEEGEINGLESAWIGRKGEKLYIRENARLHKDDNGNVLYFEGTVEDITQRKLTEEALHESQRQLFTLMSNLPGMAYRCKMDADWTMEFVSNGCLDLTGYQPDDLVDNTVVSYVEIIHPEDRWIVEEAVAKGVNNKEPFQMIYRINTSDGKEKWVWEQGRGIFGYNNELIALEGFITDITEKKTTEDQLQKSLKEKEILLRELYHRTKNNMQVISSILHLKANRIQDNSIQFIFHEIENKIHSMALVHKKLYESNDLSSLNLKTYFQDLINLIRNSYTINENQIKFVYAAVDATVLIDTAIPLGLVLNELLSNAVKHAFPNGRQGEIKIDLTKGPGGLVIDVEDNGVGLPASFDMKKNINLGLETVMDLITNQLRSEISYENHNGLKYRIVIKEELYEARI